MNWKTHWACAVSISVMLGAALLPVPARAQQLPTGSDLLDSLSFNVSNKGIDFLEDQVPGAVPAQLNLPQMQGQLFSCLFDTNDYTIKNIIVYIVVNDVQITPIDGALQVFLDADIAAEARLETSGCLFNNGCQLDLPWSSLTADTTIAIDMVVNPQTGRPMVDATVPAFSIQTNLANPQVSGCLLDGFLQFLLGIFTGTIEDAIVAAIQGQVAGQIEPLIEDAFNSLSINDTIALLDAEIAFELFLSDVILKPEGITIYMGSNIQAVEPAKCVKGGPGGSQLTPSDPPNYDTGVSPGGVQYDLAASFSDDLANQALYAAWEAGLLCMEIDSLGEGEPLTTDLLQLLGGEVSRIVTPGGAMVIKLSAPSGPPVATIQGAGAVIDIDDLRVDLIGEVHERMARLVQIKVAPTLAAEIEIADGFITPLIDFDTANMGAEIGYNELLPETGAVILTLIPTLLSSFLPSLAIDPIEIPDLAGITLESTEVTQDGPSADFLSIYTGLGGQLDLAGGCGVGGGGCGGSGCIISGERGRRRVPIVPAILAGVFALTWRRRRSE